MFQSKGIFLVLCLVTVVLESNGASKYYTDENRPYEFGFNIEGEQHRHEKKDENGLIMGEFGFLTADGVYHVTVYATDENGNFKIISMKNIRVNPYPSGSGPTKQGHSLKLPASQGGAPPPPPPATPNSDQQSNQKPNSFQPAKSCSHCSIPTTTKAPQLTEIANVNQDIQPPLVSNNNIQNYPPQYNTPNDNDNTYNSPQNPQYSQNPQQNNYDNFNNDHSNQPNYPSQSSNPNDLQNYGNQYNGEARPDDEQQGIPSSDRNPKQYFDRQESNSLQPHDAQDVSLDSRISNKDGEVPTSKPVLLSAQMQIVDRNTDVHQLNSGEREGLPNGLNKDDMSTLLYTFNYTVGFHGHHEEGYTNGVKKGYYFITGRNGIKTRVDYIADDTGFHPKISQEVLDVLSDDVPKPETEKDAKYGLRGYEFKWLYFPQDSRR